MKSIIEKLGTKKIIIICVVALLFVAAIISTVIIVKKSNAAKLAASAKTGNSASASELLSTSKASVATTDISSMAATEQTATSTSSKSTTKKTTTKKSVTTATAKATTTTTATTAAPAPAESTTAPKPKGQNLLSEYHGEDIDGNVVDSSIFNSKKVTMINIWTTSCGVCAYEMPELNTLNQKYSTNFQVIGVLNDIDNIDTAKSIIESNDYKFRNLKCDFGKGSIWEAAKKTNGGSSIQYVPYSFFVDSTGHQIGKAYTGIPNEGWESVITALING